MYLSHKFTGYVLKGTRHPNDKIRSGMQIYRFGLFALFLSYFFLLNFFSTVIVKTNEILFSSLNILIAMYVFRTNVLLIHYNGDRFILLFFLLILSTVITTNEISFTSFVLGWKFPMDISKPE